MNNTTRKSAPATFVRQEDYLRALYAITEHWQSDVKFFENELNFFRLLVNKYLTTLIDKNHITQTRLIVSKLVALEKERIELEETITLHMQHIAGLVRDPFIQNVPGYKSEHPKLENAVASFVKKFRMLKTEVFTITEKILHAEKFT